MTPPFTPHHQLDNSPGHWSSLMDTRKGSTRWSSNSAWGEVDPLTIFKSRGTHFKLKALPPEIRIILFRHYLLPEKCDSIEASALIGALRPDEEMYSEALEVFFAVRKFVISKRNRESIKTTGRAVLGRITLLEVQYSMELRKTSWDYDFTTYIPKDSLRRYTKLHTVRITTKARYTRSGEAEGLQTLVKNCIIHLPSLTKLIIEIPLSRRDNLASESPRDYIFDPTTTINKNTGLQHQWVESSGLECIAIQWEPTDKTKRMTWTDGSHTQSIPWSHCQTVFRILTLKHRVDFWYEEKLSFIGLNPRAWVSACPVEDCVCHRFIATKGPLGSADWIGLKAPKWPTLTDAERQDIRDSFKIPERLKKAAMGISFRY